MKSKGKLTEKQLTKKLKKSRLINTGSKNLARTDIGIFFTDQTHFERRSVSA